MFKIVKNPSGEIIGKAETLKQAEATLADIIGPNPNWITCRRIDNTVNLQCFEKDGIVDYYISPE